MSTNQEEINEGSLDETEMKEEWIQKKDNELIDQPYEFKIPDQSYKYKTPNSSKVVPIPDVGEGELRTKSSDSKLKLPINDDEEEEESNPLYDTITQGASNLYQKLSTTLNPPPITKKSPSLPPPKAKPPKNNTTALDLDDPIAVMETFAQLLGNHVRPSDKPKESKLVSFPTYSGGEQDPLQWLEEFQNACAVNRIIGHRMLELVPIYLKGTATTWWRRISPRIQRWTGITANDPASFVFQFKQQFCTEHHVDRWMEQLMKKVQKPGETVDEYYSDLDALYRKADPNNELNDALRKRQFIRGLRRELREPVQMAMPTTLDQALQRARAAEAAYSQDIPLSAYSLNRYYLSQGADPQIQKLQDEFQNFTKEVKNLLEKQLNVVKTNLNQSGNNNRAPRPNNNNIICHQCNLKGHIK
jgi:Retrotransposon gag protein